MSNEKGYLTPEDYAEPRCLLCDDPYGVTPQVKSVPQQRIIQKMNELMSHRDYAGAERHLHYWLEEARLGADKGGELMLRNELVGHFRKTGNKEGAFESAREALRLVEELGFENHVSAGTTYINVATAYNAFGENESAIALFEKAKQVYESNENTQPSLLGGLYNNMALTEVALGNFEAAFALYKKATRVMDHVEGGVLEQAITYLNMADALCARDGEEQAEKQVEQWLDTAYDLLTKGDAPHDGYYAFVCEKCAPVFSHYGYFLAAKELTDTAEAIYERD
ncbi:MAG: tetratricopeptide repeat protein [Clostridia bacterium]|nr:tetratricopeptide repeat protein [Clostridia bacterium]